MATALGYRVAVLVVGVLIGGGIPLLLVGVYLFHGLPFEFASHTEIVGAGASVVLGGWLIVISLLAEGNTVETVVESFQAPDAMILLFPVLIYIMSKSIWRRVRGTNDAL